MSCIRLFLYSLAVIMFSVSSLANRLEYRETRNDDLTNTAEALEVNFARTWDTDLLSGHPDYDESDVPQLRGKTKDLSLVVGKHNFTIFTTKRVNWLMAFDECRRGGGTLAEIPTQALANSLSQLSNETGIESSPLWIGATNQDRTAKFRWLSNREVNSSMIKPEKYSLHKHCLLFKWWKSVFIPFYCSGNGDFYRRGFICQAKPRNVGM